MGGVALFGGGTLVMTELYAYGQVIYGLVFDCCD